MSTPGPDPVPALAQAWASLDREQRWIDAADGGPRPIGVLVRDYLQECDPYPEGARVLAVVSRDPEEWAPGIIAQRADTDEWSVEDPDGGWIGWRDHTELRLAPAAA